MDAIDVMPVMHGNPDSSRIVKIKISDQRGTFCFDNGDYCGGNPDEVLAGLRESWPHRDFLEIITDISSPKPEWMFFKYKPIWDKLQYCESVIIHGNSTNSFMAFLLKHLSGAYVQCLTSVNVPRSFLGDLSMHIQELTAVCCGMQYFEDAINIFQSKRMLFMKLELFFRSPVPTYNTVLNLLPNVMKSSILAEAIFFFDFENPKECIGIFQRFGFIRQPDAEIAYPFDSATILPSDSRRYLKYFAFRGLIKNISTTICCAMLANSPNALVDRFLPNDAPAPPAVYDMFDRDEEYEEVDENTVSNSLVPYQKLMLPITRLQRGCCRYHPNPNPKFGRTFVFPHFSNTRFIMSIYKSATTEFKSDNGIFISPTDQREEARMLFNSRAANMFTICIPKDFVKSLVAIGYTQFLQHVERIIFDGHIFHYSLVHIIKELPQIENIVFMNVKYITKSLVSVFSKLPEQTLSSIRELYVDTRGSKDSLSSLWHCMVNDVRPNTLYNIQILKIFGFKCVDNDPMQKYRLLLLSGLIRRCHTITDRNAEITILCRDYFEVEELIEDAGDDVGLRLISEKRVLVPCSFSNRGNNNFLKTVTQYHFEGNYGKWWFILTPLRTPEYIKTSKKERRMELKKANIANAQYEQQLTKAEDK